MALSRETVQSVADLSRLELEPQELEKLAGQLQAILDFIDQLKELNLSGVAPTSHILPLGNVFREDRISPCLPLAQTLANAPEKEGNYFVVPRVVE